MASEETSKGLGQHTVETGGVQGAEHGRPEKRLARGLEDVSYLFVSQGSNVAAAREESRDAQAEQAQGEEACAAGYWRQGEGAPKVKRVVR
jgi:hypothetical protein